MNLLYRGELMRTTAMHNLNKNSNRSHSVFTVYVTQRARSGVSEKVRHVFRGGTGLGVKR